MSRDISPFGVRMPSELKKALEEVAYRNRRSLNAEIVARLEQSFRHADGSIDYSQLAPPEVRQISDNKVDYNKLSTDAKKAVVTVLQAAIKTLGIEPEDENKKTGNGK